MCHKWSRNCLSFQFFFWVSCWSILGFSVVYCISLCVLLFLSPLYCLSFGSWLSLSNFFLRRILCSQNNIHCILIDIQTWEPIRGYRDCMVVGFTTTYAISTYHHWCCEIESWSGRGVQHDVIKFVSDLWDRSVVFSTNKINRHNITEILLLKVASNTIKQTNNCPIGSFFIWAKQFCSFCSLSVR